LGPRGSCAIRAARPNGPIVNYRANYSPHLRVPALDAGHVQVDADGEHEEREEEQEKVEQPELLQLLEPETHCCGLLATNTGTASGQNGAE